MTHTSKIKSAAPPRFAPLRNVAAMAALVEEIVALPPHLPRIGCFHGFSGYGKTYAAIYAQNRTNGPRVEIGDSWTKRTLLRAILKEEGVYEPRGTIADLAEQLIMRLAEPGHPPVFIDEADKLVDKNMIELLRELYEGSQCPFILIGEELLPQKLERFERMHNRVHRFEPAQPCDIDDARKLAAYLAPKLSFSDGLLQKIVRETEGRARRIASTLLSCEQFALQTGTTQLDETYSGTISTGKSPVRGRRAA